MNISVLVNFVKKNRSLILFLLYIVIFSVVLYPTHIGLGMFWDWSWPLFKDHLSTIFSNSSSSWTDYNLGRPMVYNSSYYLNYLLSLFAFSGLDPETCLYIFLLTTATTTSFGLYLLAKDKLNSFFSFLVGLVIVLNPAYLYKLMSGHVSYLASLAIFIFFINYLYKYFKNNFRSALILSLFIAFCGAQIQFFLFAFFVLVIYYIFHWKNIKFRYLVTAIFFAFLINLPWLSNFLVGASQVAEISQRAGDIAFESASRTGILRLLTFSFSDATLIKYFYPKYLFVFFGLFSLFLFFFSLKLILSLIQNKKKIKGRDMFWQIAVTLLAFIFIATGIYQSWNIPVAKMFYPIFRESGHLALMVVLFMTLLFIELWPKHKWIERFVAFYFALFIIINAFAIYRSVPTVNYCRLRDNLAPYKEFLDNNPDTAYHVLSYPFFGQYSVAGEENREVRGQPLRNTGIDPFTQSSVYESLSNYIPAQQLDQAVQYKFLETQDLSILEERNVKYLLDLSDIYQSNVEKYSDPSYYHNNLSLIKNDPDLFSSLLQKYPDRIKQVAPHIYQLTQAKPRVEIAGSEADIYKVNTSHYQISLKNFSDSTLLNFYSSFHPDWSLYLGGTEIAASSHEELNQFGQSWYLDYSQIKKIAQDQGKNINDDGSINLDIDLYFWPQKYFLIAKYIAIATIIVAIALPCIISYHRRRSHPV